MSEFTSGNVEASGAPRLVKVSLSCEELSEENAAACCTSESIVGEANELVVVLSILTETPTGAVLLYL